MLVPDPFRSSRSSLFDWSSEDTVPRAPKKAFPLHDPGLIRENPNNRMVFGKKNAAA